MKKNILMFIIGILSVIASFGINFEGTIFKTISGIYLGIVLSIGLVLSIIYAINHWNDPEPDAPNPMRLDDED